MVTEEGLFETINSVIVFIEEPKKAEQGEKNITQKAENDKKIKNLQDWTLL